MGKYLVDTTVLVEHLRGDALAFNFLKANFPFVTHVTIAELIEGTRNKRDLKAVDNALADLPLLPLNEVISLKALDLMKKFFHSYHLEYLDSLIAVTALERKLTLVTANTKHFSFIKDLSLLDWKKLK